MLHAMLSAALEATRDVTASLAPLLVFVVIGQLLFLRLHSRRFAHMLAGLALVLVGLVVFLTGVRFAMQPVVEYLGTRMLAAVPPWVLVPVGLVLGFATAVAEPSVRVLSDQIEETTSGGIPAGLVTVAIAAGVAVLVAVAMVRTLYQLPLLWILVPGYVLAMILSIPAPRDFVAIALDAGGVVTGPMIVTFVLGLVISIAATLPGADPLRHGFGLVAHVALAPILSVLLLGIIFERRRGRYE
jgi:hypothetical protein